MEYITNTLGNLVQQTAFLNLTWGNYIMIAVACFFLYLAIKHGFEPLLLVPIAFGMLLVNIYPDIMLHAEDSANGTGGLLYYFFQLDELSPRDEADGRATFTLPGMAFARDGSGGEYHLLEDGSIGYYSSEGEAGRLAESMDDLFSLLVSCICWHDCCDTKQYVDSKTLEEYGQRQRNCNLEDMDMDSWRRVADAFGIPTDEPLAPILERFRKATQRQPLYQCIFHEDDGSLTKSYGLMFE